LSFSNVTLAPIEVTNKHGKKIVPFREDKFFVNSFPSKFFLRANAPNAHIMNNLATARKAARNISRNNVISSSSSSSLKVVLFRRRRGRGGCHFNGVLREVRYNLFLAKICLFELNK
jgi:hypothetical protein